MHLPSSPIRRPPASDRAILARVSAVLVGAALFLGIASPASGQLIMRGVVIDDSTGLGVPQAEVTLLTHYLTTLARVRTDSLGRFTFGERGAGFYRLEARRVGYAASLTPKFEIKSDKPVRLELYMRTSAPVLAPLTIVAERPRPKDFLEDFDFRRARQVNGLFFGPQDIERMGALYVTDVVRRVPGGTIDHSTGGPASVYFGRESQSFFSSIKCNPVFYLDGFRLQSDRERELIMGRLGRNIVAGDTAAAAADTAYVTQLSNIPFQVQMLSLDEVYGIEVYRGAAQIPMEFRDPFATCGVMAIWTKYAKGR
jgi:hypothetical protein